MLDEEIALVEAATADEDSDARRKPRSAGKTNSDETRADQAGTDDMRDAVDRMVERAMRQDTSGERERD